MKIIYWTEILELYKTNQKKINQPLALTIGGFDGPHIGHQRLFDSVFQKKKDSECLAGIVTFTNNLVKYKTKDDYQGEISTIDLRLDYFRLLNFDFCIVIDFSVEFSKIKGTNFLDILRLVCSMQFIAVGTDFHCGYKLDTGVAEISDYAKHYGLDYAICDSVLYKKNRVSSSIVRKSIINGDLSLAKDLLGHDYCLDATVFEWQIKSLVSNLEMIANKRRIQVIPKEGKYSVNIFTKNSCFSINKPDFIGFLYVESDFLRLEILLEQNINVERIYEQKIQRISFT